MREQPRQRGHRELVAKRFVVVRVHVLMASLFVVYGAIPFVSASATPPSVGMLWIPDRVLLSELVAPLAARLPAMRITLFKNRIPLVIGIGSRKQVIRAHAESIVAGVAHEPVGGK